MTIEITNASNVEYTPFELGRAIDIAVITKAQELGLNHITAEITEVATDETWATVDLYKKWEGYFETIRVNA